MTDQARKRYPSDLTDEQWELISSVYDYFARWRDDGTWKMINDRLVGAVRQL